MVTLSVASRSVRSKLPATFSVPMFWTVTTTLAVLPIVTAPGALTLVTATSVSGVGGGAAPPSTVTSKY